MKYVEERLCRSTKRPPRFIYIQVGL